MMDIELHLGGCLEILPTLVAGSVDLVAADPPYGTTACDWDAVIPFGPMWCHLRRILKPRGAVVMMASQPFTSTLVMSNLDWFKYCWVWEKTRPGDVFNAKNRPLKVHEDVCVFSPGTTANCSPDRMTYHPQGVGAGGRVAANPRRLSPFAAPRPSHAPAHITDGTNYPRSIIRVANPNHDSLHPTQKPVPLFEYLIRTYSDPGDTVLDFCMGSGTTGVACVNTGRRFVGIESDPAHFATAERRLAEARIDLDRPHRARPPARSKDAPTPLFAGLDD